MQQRMTHRETQMTQEHDLQSNVQKQETTAESSKARTHEPHPLEGISCRIGDGMCAAKHATVIQRTGLFHPMNGRRKVQSLLKLQRQYGNRFVQRVIAQHFLQTKLQVSQPGDIYEQEADRAADAVMRMPEPRTPEERAISGQVQGLRIQRLCPACEKELHRQPMEEEEKEELLQAQSMAGQTSEVTPDVESCISSMRGGGQPLSETVRAFFEPRFGYDFSGVRVHTDSQAAETAQAVSARAFTVGQDVVFGTGQYAPETSEGRRLLAHELTHVVQQGGQPTSIQTLLRVNTTEGPFKRGAAHAVNPTMTEDSGFHTRIVNMSGGVGPIEEEEPFTQKIGKRGADASENVQITPIRPTIGLLTSPILQRAASFLPGAVSRVFNLAENLVAGRTVGGFTPPTLNSSTHILSEAAAQNAIFGPTLSGQSLVTGDVECWVDSVPTNNGSFDMFLPTNGPWSTVATRVRIAALLGLPACAAPGNTRFSVNGQPSDADVATATETHENRHATDHETVFNNVLVPWDMNLTNAQSAHTIFSGADDSACEAALFAAMGGTPDQIATDLWNGWLAANNAFHATPAGGPLVASNPAANADCSTSSVDVR